MEQLKLAGVDLTKKESFDAVAKEFDRLLDILEDELKNKFDLSYIKINKRRCIY